MTHTEFLIIGQGISGSFLSWNLHRANRSFLVIDDGDPASPSRVAAGVINPVTGRRIVQTWMIDQLLPFALQQYQEWGNDLGIATIGQKNMIDFFPSPQMLLAFRERQEQDATYLSLPGDPNRFREQFEYAFGYGEIAPCYTVYLQTLLPAWRRVLVNRGQLLEESFDCSALQPGDRVRYRDITADKLIFCDGAASASNPYFNRLPFAFNKGEALIIEAPELPPDHIFKKALNLVPLQDGLFWAGSSYEWTFGDALPSPVFRERTLLQLRSWLRVPFRLVDHLAAVRPATIERRPFVGMHPHHPQAGILNGMGTKGCSLAPYFAAQLAHHLITGEPVLPEADVQRFRRALQ